MDPQGLLVGRGRHCAWQRKESPPTSLTTCWWGMVGGGNKKKATNEPYSLLVGGRCMVGGAGVVCGNERRAHQRAVRLVGGWKGLVSWVEDTNES